MGKLIGGVLVGLTCFLAGMGFMCLGLKGLASTRLRQGVASTGNPGIAFGLGVLVTAIMQSSSAIIALVVGLVHAQILSVPAALAITLGANVGTTLTAQLLALPFLDLWWFFWGCGGLLLGLLGAKRVWWQIGLTLIGFGTLLGGMLLLEAVLAPLGQRPGFLRLLVGLEANPWHGIGTGALFTAVVQSSSLVVSLILSLARIGFLDLEGAVMLVIGSNIGTCSDTLLVALGRSKAAWTVARAHLLFNVVGAIIFGLWSGFVPLVAASAASLPQQIANAHILFNLFTAILFMPGIYWLGRKQ